VASSRGGTKSPLTILVLGFTVIAVLAGIVSWVSETKPIMRLKPALEKTYKERGFKCWLKINDGRIEVEPPVELVLDRLGRRRLGAIALTSYLKLANYQSTVQAVLVLPPKDSGVAPEEISILETQLLGTGESVLPKLVEDASIASGHSATVTLIAPGLEGVAVILDLGSADDAAARRAATAAIQFPSVSFARVFARAGSKPIEMGREVKTFATALVTSETRR
jgi:hypothetical protein